MENVQNAELISKVYGNNYHRNNVIDLKMEHYGQHIN